MNETMENRSTNLPAEYQERPTSYLAQKLSRLRMVTPAQRAYLQAVLAGLRVTESRQECDGLEHLLNQIASSN